MLVFIGRRLLQVLPILLGVSLVVFAVVDLVPGNVIDLMVLPGERRLISWRKSRPNSAFDRPLSQYAISDLAVSCAAGEFRRFRVFGTTGRGRAADRALGNTILLACAWRRFLFRTRQCPGPYRRMERRTLAGQTFASAIAITGVSLAALLGRHDPRHGVLGLPQCPARAGHWRRRIARHLGPGAIPRPAGGRDVVDTDGRHRADRACQCARCHRQGVHGGPCRPRPQR